MRQTGIGAKTQIGCDLKDHKFGFTGFEYFYCAGIGSWESIGIIGNALKVFP